MKKSFLMGTAALLLSIPLLVSAEAPPYVTGLSAELINGEVHLRWREQPEANVSYYRVYYSFESILENDGLYDDFEETEGPEAFFVLKDPPPVDTLYLAVIGVSPQGEDADLFVEEIAVELNQEGVSPDGIRPTSGKDESPPPSDDNFSPPWEPSPDQQLPPIDDYTGEEDVLTVKDEELTLPGSETPEQPAQTQQQTPQLPPGQQTGNPPAQQPPPSPRPTTVKVLSAVATSPTQVDVVFSGPILVEPDLAPQAFSIVDRNGNKLPIVQMVIENEQAIVTTREQVRGEQYQFHVSPPAYSPEGLELDPVARSAFFMGHAQGSITQQQQVPATPSLPSGPLQGISDYKLIAIPQQNGLYTVTATWSLVGNPQELGYFIAYQTRDGGQSFGPPEALNANVGSIQIPDTAPGPFGLMLVLVRIDGMAIQGGFEHVILGQASQQVLPGQILPQIQIPVSQPTIPAPPTPAVTALTRTGPVATVLLFGTVGGMLAARRRKNNRLVTQET